jgi:hypothetical protein
MIITQVQTKVTQKAAFNGSGIDISGIEGDYTLVLTVFGLDDGAVATFQFQDSTDGFVSDIGKGKSIRVIGPVGINPALAFTGAIANYELPSGNVPAQANTAGLSTSFFNNPQRFSIRKGDAIHPLPAASGTAASAEFFAFGVTSATLRLSLVSITGSNGTDVTYQAWIEQ